MQILVCVTFKRNLIIAHTHTVLYFTDDLYAPCKVRQTINYLWGKIEDSSKMVRACDGKIKIDSFDSLVFSFHFHTHSSQKIGDLLEHKIK